MKPADALQAARNIWDGPRILEATRLNFIAAAVTPRRAYAEYINQPVTAWNLGNPTVEMPNDAPQVMKNLAWKSRTNFLPAILDVFSQLIKADGYLEANGKPSRAWKYWQQNGMDARQTGINRSALQYGAAYATVLPGDTGPAIHGYSPRRMTAVYQDPTIDDWPFLALDVQGPMLRLFDEECVYYIGSEKYPISGLGAAMMPVPDGTSWTYIERRTHGFPFCPVVRFRDRMLLDGEEMLGIIEPLIDIQRRIDETQFQMAIAQYYQAFKQRYVIGWIPQSEQEYLKTSASNFWSFKDDNVKVGTLEGTDLAPYIASKESALADLSAIAQVPGAALGTSSSAAPRNVGSEAVASMDAGRDRKSGELRTSLGESYELMLRAAAKADGDEQAASDTSSQIRWRDMTTTSPGAIVDALGKMQSMLGIPAQMLWKRVPGWTDQDQAEAENIVESGDALDRLLYTLNKQSQPQSDGTAGGLRG
ncbi:MAG TPA: phage portal protein [Acidimicrobiales bacterium]|nr:phage portal protein [Acidimicrobiales bacterium]